MSKYDELERLARLKEQGVLTDEEFQAQKKKLLDEQGSPAVPSAAPGTTTGKKAPNLPLILVLVLVPITIGLALWIFKTGSEQPPTADEAVLDSLLTTVPDTAQPQPQQPVAPTRDMVSTAVEDAMIRQIRRSELDGVQMRRGDKLQTEQGDLDGDGDEDIAVLFSLVNAATDTFTEYLAVFTNDGTGQLRLRADRMAGVDDQAQGTAWELKGITRGRLLVEVTEWGEDTTSEGIAERRETSTVREFVLSGDRITDVQ